MERIPKDFYKLFSSKYTDYYMLFLTAIYEEMSLSYSVLGLTEKECRACRIERPETPDRFVSVFRTYRRRKNRVVESACRSDVRQ